MHLHFPSTPSRSNAAIREVAREFRRKDPKFLLSASGFHSMAHLLARLRLGREYLACFFGDNYPIPRPNRLYQNLAQDQAARFSFWSLLSYTEALRAGALGLPWALAPSLVGTDLGRGLADSGHFVQADLPGAKQTGFVKALRPDVAFVHAPLGDAVGNVVVSQPSCEGFWAANGARRGVIVTVEKLVPTAELEGFRDSMPISRGKVLAVCAEPSGAHPQPLFVEPRVGALGYADDFQHYALWRQLATDDALFAHFERLVLDAADGAQGYAEFREAVRAGLGVEAPAPVVRGEEFAKSAEVMVILAARCLYEVVIAKGYRTIIAGIGQSFFASRLAKLWLAKQGVAVDVIVETGIVGLDCGEEGHAFPLSHRNIERAQRRSDVEDALGTLACGADNGCIGVIGAAQVDPDGSVNSTRVGGKLLVGPGGATDIAALATEVVVLARCDADRMVKKVEHVTSTGQRVTRVVTDAGIFARPAPAQPWVLQDVYPSWGGLPLGQALERIRAQVSWPYAENGVASYTRAISTKELMTLHGLEASAETWTREPPRVER